MGSPCNCPPTGHHMAAHIFNVTHLHIVPCGLPMQHSSCTQAYSSWYNMHLTSVPCVHPWTFVSSDFICVHYTHPFYGCIPEHLWAQPLGRQLGNNSVNRIFNMSLTISSTGHKSGFIKSQNCCKKKPPNWVWATHIGPLVDLLPLFHSSIVWRTRSWKELQFAGDGICYNSGSVF